VISLLLRARNDNDAEGKERESSSSSSCSSSCSRSARKHKENSYHTASILRFYCFSFQYSFFMARIFLFFLLLELLDHATSFGNDVRLSPPSPLTRSDIVAGCSGTEMKKENNNIFH